jgi:hypothetical protein
MSEPIAGVMPPEVAEAPCKVVWPTIGATEAGRWVGRLAATRLGIGRIFTLGNLLALATLPLSLAIFCWQLMPWAYRRYVLTNRRIVIRLGLRPRDQRSIDLDQFERIDVELLPGQEWLHAGDLVFRHGGNEVFRLPGVSRPEVFRHVCLTARSVAQMAGRRVAHAATGAD